METNLLQRITYDINICHGKPCIRGLRYLVEFLLELLSAGMSIEEILANYDDLEYEDMFKNQDIIRNIICNFQT